MENSISRRTFVTGAITACGGALIAGNSLCAATTKISTSTNLKKMNNQDFYTNGTFDAEKAKQAYFDLMNHFNYPIFKQFKGDDFWAIDFALGDFVNAGMGGIFWTNENHEGGGYLGHEIFLLPGQMIVEHAHVECDTCPPKRESWLVRHGSIYSFSVQDTPKGFPEGVEIPASQKPTATVNSAILVPAGGIDHLNKAKAKHFMMAGPEGAIVTEFGTFHDNAGLRFSNPKVKF
jgi:hypothetical protein